MDRLEMVRVRFSMEIPENQIASIISATTTPPGNEVKVFVYCREELPRDVVWLIFRRADNGVGTGSPDEIGLRLSSLLGEYGMVDHTTWRLVTGFECPEGDL